MQESIELTITDTLIAEGTLPVCYAGSSENVAGSDRIYVSPGDNFEIFNSEFRKYGVCFPSDDPTAFYYVSEAVGNVLFIRPSLRHDLGVANGYAVNIYHGKFSIPLEVVARYGEIQNTAANLEVTGGAFTGVTVPAEVSGQPAEEAWTTVAYTKATDLELTGRNFLSYNFPNPLIPPYFPEARYLFRGARIRLVGYGDGNDYEVMQDMAHATEAEPLGGDVLVTNNIRPAQCAEVNGNVNALISSEVNSFVGSTDPTTIGAGTTGASSPDDPHSHSIPSTEHYHGSGHTHTVTNFQTVIPLTNIAHVPPVNSYVEIRGAKYRVISSPGTQITIYGALAGSLFDGDPVYLHYVPAGIEIQMNLWQHSGNVCLSQHQNIGPGFQPVIINAMKVQGGSGMDSKILYVGKMIPVYAIAQPVYGNTLEHIQQITFGSFDFPGFGGRIRVRMKNIKNVFGTQTIDQVGEFAPLLYPGSEFS